MIWHNAQLTEVLWLVIQIGICNAWDCVHDFEMGDKI
jgi:hypothetical protein